MMRQEQILFEKYLQRVNLFLKFVGIFIDSKDSNRSLIERLRNHRFYCINFISLNIDVTGEALWFIKCLVTGLNLIELTYVIPCLSLCVLGNLKSYYFIKHADHVNDIVATLRKLQTVRQSDQSEDVVEKELIEKRLPFVTVISNAVLVANMIGVLAFAIGPLAILALSYYSTGELKFTLPFIVLYPFNPLVMPIWPFIYLFQLWSAWVAVFTVYGSDSFYYFSCTFIHIQFRSLQHDMENIVIRNSADGTEEVNLLELRGDLLGLVNKHRELIRCVDLLEIIHSKSILANVLCSSLVIRATAFNIMAIDNFALMAPFTPFLSMSILQIYILCYYGDTIMESSIEVSDAVYNCQWYRSNPAVMRDLLIILTRSQKPCRLTAYGFSVINLRAFTKILSTAWSYFALLTTIYGGKK